MARLPRICLPSIPQHVIQRGNDRHVCFASEEDFVAYAHWLGEFSRKYRVAIHAWVFMTNHVHLLVTPKTNDGISKMMQSLGRHYVRYFNYTYKRTGTLWEGRFKSCVINAEDYLLKCQRYIELNPVRAGMVDSPDEYTWSSYHANGLGKAVSFWSPHQIYMALDNTLHRRLEIYRDLFNAHVDKKELDQIRNATNKGLALGNDKFKDEVERLTGRRVKPLKRGPKPKARDCDNEFLL